MECLCEVRSERLMDPIYVNANHLPADDNCNFGFTKIDLPSPQEVRERAEQDGIDTTKASRPGPARFPELGLIVKWGEYVTITEGQCLRFLRQHLKEEVPVPAIYGWRREDGQTFLYLELISGNSMASLWHDLVESEKDLICKKLRQMVQSWRRIRQTPQPDQVRQISAINGDALRDIIFSDAGIYPVGPFDDIYQFHDAFANLLAPLPVQKDSINRRQEYPELAGLKDDVQTTFTHSDLDLSNILISDPKDGSVRIIAIVDWHHSGWYPEPWEWLKAQSVAEPLSEWKERYLAKVLDPAPPDYFYAWEYINMFMMLREREVTPCVPFP